MADASIVRNMLIGGIGVSVLLAVFQWLFFGGTATPLATELWHRDLGTAIDAGEQHRRPLLVLFVDDSASSVALEAQVLASPWARMATDRFIPVRLDARQKSGLAAELGARATPWMVILVGTQQVDGFAPPADPKALAERLAQVNEHVD